MQPKNLDHPKVPPCIVADAVQTGTRNFNDISGGYNVAGDVVVYNLHFHGMDANAIAECVTLITKNSTI